MSPMAAGDVRLPAPPRTCATIDGKPKISFTTRKRAERQIARLRGKGVLHADDGRRMHAYRCHAHGSVCWHIGHAEPRP